MTKIINWKGEKMKHILKILKDVDSKPKKIEGILEYMDENDCIKFDDVYHLIQEKIAYILRTDKNNDYKIMYGFHLVDCSSTLSFSTTRTSPVAEWVMPCICIYDSYGGVRFFNVIVLFPEINDINTK